jgi:hypothetical protein
MMAAVKPCMYAPGGGGQKSWCASYCLAPKGWCQFQHSTKGQILHGSLYGSETIVSEKGTANWEEDLYCKIIEICVETIFPYHSAQTIGTLCDHSGPWDMDDFQAANQCEF